MFGRTVFPTSSVFPTRVSADGAPDYKPGGVTIDWANTVTAPGSDTTLADGSVIKSGFKFLRYGQVLTKIGTDTDTVTIGGSPTGGTFTLTVTIGGTGQTTSGIAFNATAATVQTALTGLSNVGTGNATVSGSAGGPYTITFADALGAVTLTGSAASLTGGTPTLTVAATATGGNKGWFGPYDPAATDGRQTLARGSCYVLDETLLQYGGGITHSVSNDNVGGVIEGGLIFIDRVLQAGTGSHTLAAGPTLAEFLAAFPAFRIAQD